ncbi:MAG: V-type ATP synthase subunit E [candidate division WOR-3 bacterium]
MGTKELVDKILADARERVAAIDAEREKEIKEIEERLKQTEERLIREQRERVEKRVGVILENAKSKARLEAKKILLEAKWRVIEKICERARDAILKNPEYVAILKRLLEKYAGADATVHLSENDRARFGSQLGTKLGEPVPISGGAIIRKGKEEIDLSLDSILNLAKEELITELAQTLFPEG